MTSPDYCLPAIDVLNKAVQASSNNKKLSKQRAQELIDEWCSVGYFVDLDDVIHFGPRMIGEFSDYLRLKFRDHIRICCLCNQPTFKVNFFEKKITLLRNISTIRTIFYTTIKIDWVDLLLKALLIYLI